MYRFFSTDIQQHGIALLIVMLMLHSCVYISVINVKMVHMIETYTFQNQSDDNDPKVLD